MKTQDAFLRCAEAQQIDASVPNNTSINDGVFLCRMKHPPTLSLSAAMVAFQQCDLLIASNERLRHRNISLVKKGTPAGIPPVAGLTGFCNAITDGSIAQDPTAVKIAAVIIYILCKIGSKMHYAVHGQTAAELIISRADHSKEHMGLTSWKNAPDGRIVKTDVSVAKNYLQKEEAQELNEIVTMYLDYATRQARRHMTMADWAQKLDAFLQFNDAEILHDKDKVTMTAE